ncbi:MAG: VWA domain-containing protein [Desulfopila sp.]
METLTFAQPYWLLVALVAAAITMWIFHLMQVRRQKTLEKFAAAKLLKHLTRHVSRTRRRVKNGVLLLAIVLLFVALARPQYGSTWVEVKRKGIDILFALDTSKSMLAEDTRPNRLQRARLGIMDFVAKLGGDRIGLMPFAGTAYLMCPLTLDYDAFTDSLNSVSTDIIPQGGTNISAVIQEAEEVLHNDANHKVLILLTDGENLEGDAVRTAREARTRGLTIYTVGVGTASGELIPLGDGTGSGFVKDENGTYVTSKLDEKRLAAIAKASGGISTQLGNDGEGLEKIYQQKLQLIPKEERVEKRQKVPLERFGWPLTAAILLLLLEYLLPERRAEKKLPLFSPPSMTRGGKLLAIVLLCGLFTTPPQRLWASAAEEAYSAGDYQKAAEIYGKALKKHPEDPKLHFNFGTTAYKNSKQDEAIASFSEALMKSDDLSLQQKAYYNRGNAQFQKGVESRQDDPQATIDSWQEALDSYDGALHLDPQDAQARDNRDYVAKKLAELKQQQQKQQKSDNRKQNNDNDQQQKKNQDNQQNSGKNGENNQQQNSVDTQRQNDHERQKSQNGTQDNDQNQLGPQQQDTSADQQPKEARRGPEHNSRPQSASEGTRQQQDQAADQHAAAQHEEKGRHQPGKMTQDEAKNLLDALKNEEGELNFGPRRQDAPTVRDW